MNDLNGESTQKCIEVIVQLNEKKQFSKVKHSALRFKLFGLTRNGGILVFTINLRRVCF